MTNLNSETAEICHELVNKFGSQAQFEKIKEEIFEYGQALCHFQKGKLHITSLAKEVDDVLIGIEQLLVMLPALSDCVQDARRKNLHHLKLLLDGAEQLDILSTN